MRIVPKPSEVTVTFSPEEYCLVKCSDITNGDYSLNYLIDRSEKGKDDDIGLEVMYLSEEQAKIFKQAGFIQVCLSDNT